MQTWGAERAGDLAALVAASMPGEGLIRDELQAACWDDPGLVLGSEVGAGTERGVVGGAVAAVLRDTPEGRIGFVKVLAVAPGDRRLGHGRALLDAAEAWAWDQGAAEVRLGGSAPFYLWPGVDVRFLGMLCLAEAAGYAPTGAACNMSVPATHRAPCPEGLEVRRVLDDADASAAAAMVGSIWPEWSAEAGRAIEQGTCLAAFDGSDRVAAFACHSVNRAGWLGPIGTDPQDRGRGIGSALVGEVCRDLMVAGYTDVEISWIGPVRFYASAGGAISRVFRTLVKRRP